MNPDIARALKEEESAVLRETAARARQAGHDPARRAPASRTVRRHGDVADARAVKGSKGAEKKGRLLPVGP